MKKTITNVIDTLNNKFKYNSVMTADDAHELVQQVIEKETVEFIDKFIKPACEQCRFWVEVPMEEPEDSDALNKRNEIEIRLGAYGYSIEKQALNDKVTRVSWGEVEKYVDETPHPREIIE